MKKILIMFSCILMCQYAHGMHGKVLSWIVQAMHRRAEIISFQKAQAMNKGAEIRNWKIDDFSPKSRLHSSTRKALFILHEAHAARKRLLKKIAQHNQK